MLTAFSNWKVIAGYPPRSRRSVRNCSSGETQRGTTPITHSDGPARGGRRRCSSSDTRGDGRDPTEPRHHVCIYLIYESSINHGGVGFGVARHVDLPDARQDFIADLDSFERCGAVVAQVGAGCRRLSRPGTPAEGCEASCSRRLWAMSDEPGSVPLDFSGTAPESVRSVRAALGPRDRC